MLRPSLLPLFLSTFFGSGCVALLFALLGDYEASEASPEPAWANFRLLCLAVSAAFSPLLGPRLASDLPEMQVLVLKGAALIFAALLLLPAPSVRREEKRWTVSDFAELKVARSGAGLWHLGWGFLLALLSHVGQTLAMPSLRGRFGADVEMLGQLQAATVLGAILGSPLSAPAERAARGPRMTALMMAAQASALTLAAIAERLVMLCAGSWSAILLAGAASTFLAFGLVNPLRGALPRQFVPKDERDGYLALQQCADVVSGVAGPALAGILGASSPGLCPVPPWVATHSRYLRKQSNVTHTHTHTHTHRININEQASKTSNTKHTHTNSNSITSNSSSYHQVLLLCGCAQLSAWLGCALFAQPAIERLAELRKLKPE